MKSKVEEALLIREVITRDLSSGVTHEAVSATAAIFAIVFAMLVFFSINSHDDAEKEMAAANQTQIPTPITAAELPAIHGKTEHITRASKSANADWDIHIAIQRCLWALLVVYCWEGFCLWRDRKLDKCALEIAFSMLDEVELSAMHGDLCPEAERACADALNGCMPRAWISRPKLSPGAIKAIQMILTDNFNSFTSKPATASSSLGIFSPILKAIGCHLLLRALLSK